MWKEYQFRVIFAGRPLVEKVVTDSTKLDFINRLHYGLLKPCRKPEIKKEKTPLLPFFGYSYTGCFFSLGLP